MSVAFNLTPDRVAVFDTAFAQVFPFARPVNVRVSERSQMLDHPIETGQIITDYSIVLPIEIEISFIVESVFYQEMYQQIRGYFVNKELLTVQTSTASYLNMVIADMPHEERPDLYDALPISVHFRQIQVVPNPTTYAPADPQQTDTKTVGQQTPYEITGVQTMQGTQTIPSTSYSSVPPANSITASGVQTMSGPQTVTFPADNGYTITGAQTLTPEQSLGSSFGGVPIGSQ